MRPQTLKHKLFCLLLVLDCDEQSVGVSSGGWGCWLWELARNDALCLDDFLVKRILEHQRRLWRHLRVAKRSNLTLIHVIIDLSAMYNHRRQPRHRPIIIAIIPILRLEWVRTSRQLMIQVKLVANQVIVVRRLLQMLLTIGLAVLVADRYAAHHPRLQLLHL